MGPSLSCREFVDFLADYLAGTLSEEGVATLDAHLAACPSCVSYMRSYLEAVRIGRLVACDEPAPPDLPPELVEAILAARRP